MIRVAHREGNEWEVSVESRTPTTHRVQVSPSDLDRLGNGRSAEDLLRASFEFLLEREPNTAILSSFPLPLISRYFPEYEVDIQKRLGRRSDH